MHEKQAAAALSDPARRAQLELTGAPQAGVWLHTCPSPSHQNNIDPFLFRTSILRWLRAPLAESDGICPLCDGVLDRFGDHCLVCPCGGDRTKRHNLLRNSVSISPLPLVSTQNSKSQGSFSLAPWRVLSQKMGFDQLRLTPGGLRTSTCHGGAAAPPLRWTSPLPVAFAISPRPSRTRALQSRSTKTSNATTCPPNASARTRASPLLPWWSKPVGVLGDRLLLPSLLNLPKPKLCSPASPKM